MKINYRYVITTQSEDNYLFEYIFSTIKEQKKILNSRKKIDRTVSKIRILLPVVENNSL